MTVLQYGQDAAGSDLAEAHKTQGTGGSRMTARRDSALNLDPQGRARAAPGRSPLGWLNHASSGVALLIVTAISILFGWFFAVPALVLGLVALLLERRSDPRSAAVARWGWITYVAGAVLLLVYGVVLVLVAGYAASGNN
ncbi:MULTISPECIES: hypothetical protein [unclassified Knoellia]|uniref:hypothetical protein n=1 Tax=Knoellia altitudinis TaxID=3404795 RepID=UPI0036145A89